MLGQFDVAVEFRVGDFSLQYESKERSGNARNSNVSRDITENNSQQTAREIACQMKVSCFIVIHCLTQRGKDKMKKDKRIYICKSIYIQRYPSRRFIK